MADQRKNPPAWSDTMSDGCTWAPDWLPIVGDMKADCIKHDRAYHYGGKQVDKDKADLAFRRGIEDNINRIPKWLRFLCRPVIRAVAYERFKVVKYFGDGAFNWEGPGMPENR